MVPTMSAVDSFRPRVRSAARIAAALFLACIATGCTKLLYNRLDTLAGWYLGSLVSLDPEQKRDLRAWLTRTLDWHRASELGRYAEFLHGLTNQIAAPGDRASYERVEKQIEAFGDAVVAQATPEAARMLLKLSDAQLDELDRNLDERSVERAEEDQKAIDKGAWRMERARDLRRQLKRWTGTVTDGQKALIEQAAAQFEPTSSDWLESQRQWRRLLIEALRARPATPATEERVLQLLRRPDAHWTHGYTAKSERNREHSFMLLESLDASLTPAQREHLRRELAELAEQLDALRAEP
jgi:flagellar biosynthesis chaperone FliJ